MAILDRFDIKGRSAFVTGAASGIGLAYAEAMAEAGASVTLTDIDADGAEREAARLRAEGHDARADKLDVSDWDQVVAAFDANPEAAIARGVTIPVFPDSDLETFVTAHFVKLAILCVPVEFAQAIVNRLVVAGIQGVLNFSPITLEVPPDVTVNNVDLALELEHLSYFIR